MKSINEFLNEGKQKDMNDLSSYISQLSKELESEKNPKAKKLIQSDLDETKEKLEKLKAK